MPPTTRRNGGSQAAKTDPSSNMPPPPVTSSTLSSRPPQLDLSPFYLLVYPTILALGTFFSAISPTATSAPAGALTPGVASELNSLTTPPPINYFASKHNLLNLYFVKIDWFWTTLAFGALAYTTHVAQQAGKASPNTRSLLQAAIRYSIVTAAWVGTTQWLFGPPLIDRSFTFTGGRCEALPAKLDDDGRSDLSAIATGIACKAVGGRWKGGHDISGHVFLLVLSSAFLVLELYISDALSPHPHVSLRAAAAVAHETTDEEKREFGGWESDVQAKVRLWTRYFVWTVVGLDFWMLLMTAIWFHTWFEKLSGLLLSGSCIWALYYMPALLPAWRAVVGPV